MNILIVDDRPGNLKLLRYQLECEGHTVFDAGDGVDALALLERQPVDAVISDILMPRMDGYRLCHRIRKSDNLCDLPVIFYTATYTSPADEKLACDVGANKYLKKPASVEALLAALHEVVGQPSAAPPARVLPEGEVLKEYSEALVAKLEEKNTELTAAEAKFRTLVEQSLVGIYIIQEERFVYVNPKMSAIFGRSEAEMTSRPVYDFIVPEDHALVRENLRQRISGEVPSIHYQLRMVHQSGAVLQIEIHGGRAEFNGRPAVMGTLLDLTERKQMEAQFLRSQRMESLGSLAGGIAHDLNNALAPIAMASEFLKLTCTDAETSRVLDTICDSAKRGAGMVKQILTFARGTEGERGGVQPKHLVKEMIDMARHTFPKAIQIRTDIATDTWPLHGNPTQLHQILLNLCVNARDAMPNGGILTLAAGNVHLDATCAQLSPDAKPGSYVLLTVTDTGTGMPPEVRARIFDAFFTTKTPDKGTGLGLSTVQNIVKDHGGFLTVDSAMGQGTTFKVYLPAQETTAVTATVAMLPALPTGNGELILVVDDEAAIRNIATQTIEAFGYRVVTANDGAQAVGVCAQNLAGLQLLITDMAMPIMDGKATIRAIRTLLPRLPVIAVSGSDSLAGAPLQKELDVQALLRKPFSAEDLIRTIHAVLQEKAPS